MYFSRLFAVFLFFNLICSVYCVDRSRFKTCSNSGFCSRNREFAQGDHLSGYEVVPSSFSLSPGRFSSILKHQEIDQEFVLTITQYEKDIIRVQIKEKDPLFPRYSAEDILLDSVKQSQVQPEYKGESDRIFGKVQLLSSPFGLNFYSDNELVISANSRGLFNIEYFRQQNEEQEQDNEEHNNLEENEETTGVENNSKYRKIGTTDTWTETFGGKTDSKPRGPSSISLDFSFLGSENVYGIPEHASSFSLKSTGSTDPYRLYNLDVFEYELDETMALYGSIPLMISQRPGKSTAIFWMNSSETWIDINHKVDQQNKQVDTHWMSETGELDFFILLGPSPKDIFSQYAYLTGTQELPPEFSLGYHQCRWNYKDQQDVSQVHSKFDEYDLPFDVIWLDIEHTNRKKYFTWDAQKFPNSIEMINDLASKGRRMVTIVDPHILKESGYHIYDGGNRNNYWVKQADGVSDYEGHCWPGTSMYLDFSNREVREYWSKQFSLSNYQGSTLDLFIWNDMNEPSVFNGPEVTMPKDLIHHGNVEHRELHNLFGMWVHQATHDGLIARNSTPHRSFVLSRAFFAGSQRFGAIWTGDNKADWQHLEASVPMLLSISISGISFCGADVGGFFGNPEEELLIRWYQAGAFQPFFRAHAHIDTKRREPYLYGENTVNIIRDSLRNRYQFLSYWYKEFYYTSKTGIPVMRPLWIEYPNDQNTYSLEDQYLIGSDLLVKPITSKGQTSTSVYFPNDSQGWFDVFTYEFFEPGVKQVSAPLDKIPVFQRAGSIIAKKERARRSSTQMINDPYTLVVALNDNQQAEGYFYLDDGISFAYESGEFIERKFSFTDNRLTSSSIKGTKFDTKVVVERIVILGLETPIHKATVEQQGFSLDVKVIVQKTSDNSPIYILKKPNCMIGYDWRVTLS